MAEATTNNAQLDTKLPKFRVAPGASGRPVSSVKIAHPRAASGFDRVGARAARLLRRDDLRECLIQAHRRSGGGGGVELGGSELLPQRFEENPNVSAVAGVAHP